MNPDRPADSSDSQFLSPPAASQIACAICGSYLSERSAVRLGRSCLRVCAQCGSWTYFPRAGTADQAAIHNSEDYFSHPYFELRRTVTAAQRRRCRELFLRLSPPLELATLKGQNLLDIGCDTGAFLRTAQEEFGIVPIGIDVAERSVQAARREGVEAYQTTIEEAPARVSGFSVITAIDLIEHVPDPKQFLGEVRKRLRPNGVLYLETPNIDSMVYRAGQVLSGFTGGHPRKLLERLFPPQHLQYFNPGSLRRLAQSVGFEIIHLSTRVLPGSDISVSAPARGAIGLLQAADRLCGREILICAGLRRPAENSHLGECT
jgi:2-polyprenyl-3-methyl-5-hydroxy-6-metoxy-1,4-benzoquinol methylase